MAIRNSSSRTPQRFFTEDRPVSEWFGCCVFDGEKTRKYLSDKAFAGIQEAIRTGRSLDRSLAGDIASGMKTWALELGATHYTHLFQPLTGNTAEKHEAFIALENGRAIEQFKGSALVQQEPDASSFPNGGLRNTFEARGYSAWDPASPVFVLDGTLCIPSVFVSYTGDALDMKTPHLRSIAAISREATALAKLFDPEVASVRVNCGLEQEYFLVDEALYNARPDLQLCNRTVIGHTSAKDQQLSDHYFGAIPSRVECFMKDFETLAWKLGIQLRTRHNEVAPNQFECAPEFCEATRAIDQNMLLMIIMQKVAVKHHLKVIFHEKPFDGINGSGKHCNWSLQTDTGVNLFSPGATPMKNLRFLSFYVCVLRAVYRHNSLLMASVCSLGNTWRLGGHEAPPAILSVFSGTTLKKVFDAILKMEDLPEAASESIRIVRSIPEIFPDNTDRNRTSPFAFTGNRFEFRAVGSSANAAASEYVLNTVVAESIRDFCEEVQEGMASGKEKDTAVIDSIRKFLAESKDVMFEGNGYSREWHEEAARRGLKPANNAPEAFKAYIDPSSVATFSAMGVLTPTEIQARYEVLNETFVKKLQIEARVEGDICRNHIIPAAVAWRNTLAEGIRNAQEVFGEESASLCRSDIEAYRKVSELVNTFSTDLKTLLETRHKAIEAPDTASRAKLYSTEVMEAMAAVRRSADALETMIDDELWPLPKYRELLSL